MREIHKDVPLLLFFKRDSYSLNKAVGRSHSPQSSVRLKMPSAIPTLTKYVISLCVIKQ
jgi:hypothetical protein